MLFRVPLLINPPPPTPVQATIHKGDATSLWLCLIPLTTCQPREHPAHGLVEVGTFPAFLREKPWCRRCQAEPAWGSGTRLGSFSFAGVVKSNYTGLVKDLQTWTLCANLKTCCAVKLSTQDPGKRKGLRFALSG